MLCYENNPLVRKALEEPGQGRVLVVDGGASTRCVAQASCIIKRYDDGDVATGVRCSGTRLRKWRSGTDGAASSSTAASGA